MPPGATVYLDGENIGTSPVDKDFWFFGTREITAVHPGYARTTRMVPIEGSWYEGWPWDFFTEFLPLFPRTDIRVVQINLRKGPQRLSMDPENQSEDAAAEAILKRARELKGWDPSKKTDTP